MQFQARPSASKPKGKRGISYGRVSTFDQAYNKDGNRREDASPEAQRSRCCDHVRFLNSKNSGYYEILQHLSDEGFSGKNTRRPGYQRMWDLVGSESIDFIVTTELSRISRSVGDFLELVAHCEEHKVDLLIIGLDLDTSTPIGRVMVIILVALAQFEREMTSQRVRENALSRLLKDGKINGAAEILGLDRDPQRVGHFVVNAEELQRAEQILRLFLKSPSKHKTLAEAKKIGLTGKKGRELTHHMVDSVIANARWRYRGLWYANKDKQALEQSQLPEAKRFQVVGLPHGPLLDLQLLDRVSEKLTSVYDQRKRSGKDGRIYLLSHILQYEDGSTYYGGPAKDRQYFYYYCKGAGPNVSCEALEQTVLSRVKAYFRGSEAFTRLLEEAVKKRISELPKIDQEIARVQKGLQSVEEENGDLRQQLRDKGQRSRTGFIVWLEEEVEKLKERKVMLDQSLATLLQVRGDIIKKSALDCLERTSLDFIAKFDQLTGVQKRDFIERMIAKIIIKKDNKLELHVLWDPRKTVTGVTKSTIREEDGGRDGT